MDEAHEALTGTAQLQVGMNPSLLRRLESESGCPNLVQTLVERLAPTDLQSLLLEVYAQIAGRVSPARVLSQYENNRFVAPSVVDARRLVEVDRLAWELLPTGYVPIELAPLCPLGTNSAIAPVHQNKVVTTI